MVSLTLFNGSTIELDPPVTDEELISSVRKRIGEKLGVHEGRIALFLSGSEAADWQTMKEVIGDTDTACKTLTVVKQTCVAKCADYDKCLNHSSRGLLTVDEIRKGRFAFSGQVSFPEPSGIDINMMPFLIGHKESLPAEMLDYWPLIEACHIPTRDHGKVGYLTVKESHVEAGETQRREGLHVESPGFLLQSGTFNQERVVWGCGLVRMDKSEVEGGTYMTSNVDASCMAWDVQIQDASFVGDLGSIEHLREYLPEGTPMRANSLYWLTDLTPHEALPMTHAGHRQFFRVVAGPLKFWYEAHSAPNPLVAIGPETTILEESKFNPLQPQDSAFDLALGKADAKPPANPAKLQPQKVLYTTEQADGFPGVAFRVGTRDAEPSLDIPNGLQVQCLGEYDDWLALKYQDKVGFVKRRNVKVQVAGRPDRPKWGAQQALVAARDPCSMPAWEYREAEAQQEGVSFYLGVELQHNTSGLQIPEGTEMRFLGRALSYAVVDYEGRLGYVEATHLTTAAEWRLLQELLDSAKLQGGSADVWDGIRTRLSQSPTLVNRRGGRTFNLLHHAAFWGQLDVVKWLVQDFHAGSHVRTKDGKLPVQVAAKQKHGKDLQEKMLQWLPF